MKLLDSEVREVFRKYITHCFEVQQNCVKYLNSPASHALDQTIYKCS